MQVKRDKRVTCGRLGGGESIKASERELYKRFRHVIVDHVAGCREDGIVDWTVRCYDDPVRFVVEVKSRFKSWTDFAKWIEELKSLEKELDEAEKFIADGIERMEQRATNGAPLDHTSEVSPTRSQEDLDSRPDPKNRGELRRG